MKPWKEMLLILETFLCEEWNWFEILKRVAIKSTRDVSIFTEKTTTIVMCGAIQDWVISTWNTKDQPQSKTSTSKVAEHENKEVTNSNYENLIKAGDNKDEDKRLKQVLGNVLISSEV